MAIQIMFQNKHTNITNKKEAAILGISSWECTMKRWLYGLPLGVVRKAKHQMVLCSTVHLLEFSVLLMIKLQYTVLPPTGLFQALGGPLSLPRHTRPCPFPFLFTKAVDRQSK